MTIHRGSGNPPETPEPGSCLDGLKISWEAPRPCAKKKPYLIKFAFHLGETLRNNIEKSFTRQRFERGRLVVRRSGVSAVRRFGGSAVRRFGGSLFQRIGASAFRRFGGSMFQRLGGWAYRGFGGSAVPRFGGSAANNLLPRP